MADTPEDPRPAPRRRFRDTAVASGLLTGTDLDAAEAEVMRRLGATSRTPEQFDKAVAGVLVEQGKLTPFQAREMQIGRTVFRLGQYTVIDAIGKGGMGQVFRAEHALMGRHVAVKVLPRAKATPESEAAFRREMRILGRLDHENLVRAFDAGYDAQVYYLVTELVPGLNLRQLVEKNGPLDEITAASVFSQAARGLACAHAQSLVHRDVKPGNILVMDDGRVKLLDLGLAGSTIEAEAVRLGRVVGTMDYIAPEQIRSPDDVGPPADIYALGCSMYFALTGEVPFPKGSRKDKMRRHLTEAPKPIREHESAAHLPQALCKVVEAMMSKSVADRIGSADEVIRRLARWTPERPLPIAHRARDDDPSAAVVLEASTGASSGEPAWPVLPEAQHAASSPPSLRVTTPAADEAGFQPVLREVLGVMRSSRALSTAVQVLAPAVLAGVGFTIAVNLVRGIDARRFDELLGDVTPATCGFVAFLLMGTMQAAARVGRRHRR